MYLFFVPLDFMNFSTIIIFILSSVLLIAESESSLEESYKELVENSILTEKQHELANSAMAFVYLIMRQKFMNLDIWLEGLSLLILTKMNFAFPLLKLT